MWCVGLVTCEDLNLELHPTLLIHFEMNITSLMMKRHLISSDSDLCILDTPTSYAVP